MAGRILRFLDGSTSAETGATTNVQNDESTEYAVLQVEITGSATVVVEGRVDANMPWVTIDTYTSSDGGRITVFPQMRARVTTYSSGTINVALAV